MGFGAELGARGVGSSGTGGMGLGNGSARSDAEGVGKPLGVVVVDGAEGSADAPDTLETTIAAEHAPIPRERSTERKRMRRNCLSVGLHQQGCLRTAPRVGRTSRREGPTGLQYCRYDHFSVSNKGSTVGYFLTGGSTCLICRFLRGLCLRCGRGDREDRRLHVDC